MINGKTEVRMLKNSSPNNIDTWTEGQLGYIDGYCSGGDIAVVLGKKVVMCDTWDVEVIDENRRLIEEITSGLTKNIGPR
mgnify:CR=1 FL=1